ncbi:protein SPEC3-like [Amphiura filiformis]|uniref:protein SPEC3-like n=1 Tax=Amphiura filiformis TaxID=82378 RepID=UPI003B221591
MTTVVATGGGGGTTVVVTKNESHNACRAAIPAMHIGMAVFCLIVNIFMPGIGTIFAGFSVFCCANKGASGGEMVATLCINFWVGLLQIGTVWFFFLGWIWSIMWGAAFLGMSADYHKSEDDNIIVVNSAPPPQPAAPIIVNNTTMMGGQQAPPQQYPPPQQQQQGPPPAYQGQGQMPGEVQEHKM